MGVPNWSRAAACSALTRNRNQTPKKNDPTRHACLCAFYSCSWLIFGPKFLHVSVCLLGNDFKNNFCGHFTKCSGAGVHSDRAVGIRVKNIREMKLNPACCGWLKGRISFNLFFVFRVWQLINRVLKAVIIKGEKYKSR